jgi:hypothetical protein
MNGNLKSFSYQELDDQVLEADLKDQGMVFVHLNKRRAKAYIRYLNNGLAIELSKRFGYGNWKVLRHLFAAIAMLPWIMVFHSKLLEMDTFRIVNELRCTWDIEDNGMYRFTFS